MSEPIIENSREEAIERLQHRVRTIEREAAGGGYRPGEWTRLVSDLQRLPRAERAALSDDISRASRALHRRHVTGTISIQRAIAAELGRAVVGAILVALGGAADSNLFGAAGALAWVVAFQPLLKYASGRMLGLGYDYAYLFGIEPRLKMNYGSYLAAPRWARVLLHLSGTFGSPLGALLGWAVMPSQLVSAAHFCMVEFGLLHDRRLEEKRVPDGSQVH